MMAEQLYLDLGDSEPNYAEMYLEKLSAETGVPVEELRRVEAHRQMVRESNPKRYKPRNKPRKRPVQSPYGYPYIYQPVHKCLKTPSWQIVEEIRRYKFDGWREPTG